MGDKISCIITDDEPYARKGLQGYIEQISFLELKGSCEDALQLGEVLKEQPVDLLFLDIQMPYLLGTDFLKTLVKPPKVIFTTAFEQYAIQGFELDVLDYLLKPISFERFLKAADKAHDYFKAIDTTPGTTSYLFFKVNGKLEKVILSEILFISGLENYVVIQMINKQIITHTTIKSLLDKLPESKFIQTHKSYIVSVDKVHSIGSNALEIHSYKIPVSRTLRNKVMAILLR